MIKPKIKVAIVYRSYESNPFVSHAGLAIAAINTSKTLNQYGIPSEVWPCESAAELEEKLKWTYASHIMIQAPWIDANTLTNIAKDFPDTQFAVNCHSNVGFLQTDPGSMRLMLDMLDVEQASSNIHAASNTREFCKWIRSAYQSPCTLLPNLYYLDKCAHAHRPLWNGGLLRIGIFGAPRPQKNVMTGVAAAIEIAQMLKAHTEIWVNRGRDEKHGQTILAAAKIAIERNPYCTYKEFSWASWPQFRRFLGSMNLLIQASYTESFNQVTADGISQGVPTVVSPSIRWAPERWKADPDSAESIAYVGRYLIGNPLTRREGLEALEWHNRLGLMAWKKYLSGKYFTRDEEFGYKSEP